jgi:hypothetical protein
MNIDWSLFDWEEIFGTVTATEGLKRNQTRGLRTEIQEISTAKHSSKQFQYVGDTQNGRDYIDINGFIWEDKASEGMFLKRKERTKKFVLKNFRGNQTNFEKTFDYLLLKDTKNMSVGWVKWKDIEKNIEIKDAVITSFVDYSDLRMIEFYVTPKPKEDISKDILKLIEKVV